MTSAEKHAQTKQAQQAARHTTVAGLLTNAVLTLIKGGGGWVSGSQALVADAIHSLADLITDIISFVAVHLGRAEADHSHPYGHGKFETFGTLILSVFLVATAVSIGWNVIHNIMAEKEALGFGAVALIAAGSSVLLNEALFRYCLHEGEKVNAKPIIANAWHHRADGLSSVAVFAGIALQLIGFEHGDALAAGIVVLFLLKVAYTLGRDAFNELVDAAIPASEQASITATITSTEGVKACHLLRGRRIGNDTILDVHVDVDPFLSVSEGHRIAELVEHHIKKAFAKVTDVTVHIDPAEHEHEPQVAAAQPSREEMEALIKTRVAYSCPDAKVSNMTLHFVDHEIQADIVFSAFPHTAKNQPSEKCKDALETALLKEDTPFKNVRLLIKL